MYYESLIAVAVGRNMYSNFGVINAPSSLFFLSMHTPNNPELKHVKTPHRGLCLFSPSITHLSVSKNLPTLSDYY